MRKGRIGIGVALAAAAALAILSMAHAVEGGGKGAYAGKDHFGPPPIRRLIQGNIGRLITLKAELDLTGEQRGQIMGIVSKYKTERHAALKGLFDARKALRKAAFTEKPDEAAIRAAGDGIGKAVGELATLVSKIAGEIKPILTPEQVELLKTFNTEFEGSIDKWLDEMEK